MSDGARAKEGWRTGAEGDATETGRVCMVNTTCHESVRYCLFVDRTLTESKVGEKPLVYVDHESIETEVELIGLKGKMSQV